MSNTLREAIEWRITNIEADAFDRDNFAEEVDAILDAVIASLPELTVKGSLYANNFQNGRRKYHKEVVTLLQQAKDKEK